MNFIKEDELFWLCITHRIWHWTQESAQLHTLTLLIIFRRAFSRRSDIYQAENYSRSRSSEEHGERFCLFVLDLNEDKLLSLLLQQMPQNFIRKTFAPTKLLNLHPWKFLPLLNLLDKTSIFPAEKHWHAAKCAQCASGQASVAHEQWCEASRKARVVCVTSDWPRSRGCLWLNLCSIIMSLFFLLLLCFC